MNIEPGRAFLPGFLTVGQGRPNRRANTMTIATDHVTGRIIREAVEAHLKHLANEAVEGRTQEYREQCDYEAACLEHWLTDLDS